MVQNTNFIKTKNGKIIHLYKISAAMVYMPVVVIRIYSEIYIGQTINRYSVRWNTHSHNWNKNTLDFEKAA